MGFIQNVFYIGNSCEMIGCLDPAHGHSQGLQIQKASMIELNISAISGDDHVEDTHVNAAVTQLVNDVRANESGSAGYQNVH